MNGHILRVDRRIPFIVDHVWTDASVIYRSEISLVWSSDELLILFHFFFLSTFMMFIYDSVSHFTDDCPWLIFVFWWHHFPKIGWNILIISVLLNIGIVHFLGSLHTLRLINPSNQLGRIRPPQRHLTLQILLHRHRLLPLLHRLHVLPTHQRANHSLRLGGRLRQRGLTAVLGEADCRFFRLLFSCYFFLKRVGIGVIWVVIGLVAGAGNDRGDSPWFSTFVLGPLIHAHIWSWL
jgi:hypothetical protein